MHLIISGMYFCLNLVLVLLYMAVPISLLLVFRWRLKVRKASSLNKNASPCFWNQTARRSVLFFVAAILAFNSVQYVKLRIKWMGDDNANLEAKNYFVVGQVVSGNRLILETFLHPDNKILVPFIEIQKRIYSQGVQCLPENDGERGVWLNLWFVYHHGRKFLQVKGTLQNIYNPLMVALLDKAWESLETMATMPYADKQIKYEHYYRDFPGLALYYSYAKEFYNTNPNLACGDLWREPGHLKRMESLFQWLEALEAKWQKHQQSMKFLKDNPEVAYMAAMSQIHELAAILHGYINKREFSCDAWYVTDYLRIRKELLVDGVLGGEVHSRGMRGFVQTKLIDWWVGRGPKYLYREYCGLETVGNEDTSFYEPWAKSRGTTTHFEMERRLRNGLSKEINILEGMGYERRNLN